MSQGTPCSHLTSQPDLEVLFVTDTYLSIAQAFTRCTACLQHYQIELVDLTTSIRAFRISTLPSQVVAATVQSLQKGSCDVDRAGAELSFVSQSAELLPGVMLRQEHSEDAGDNKTVRWLYTELAPGMQVPRADWRSLACDGSFIKSLNCDI